MLICRLLETFLQEEGIKDIDLAADAAAAEKNLALHAYDIVFLDWNLPDKSGYRLLQDIRARKKYDGMAAVMVTAESEERFVIQALKAGATAYITKPVSKDAFSKNLHKTISWLERVRERVEEG